MNGLYQKVKIDLDRFLSQQKHCCKKGCAYCCYQLIEVLNVEYNDIQNFITTQLDDTIKNKVKENLVEWFKLFNENTLNNTPLGYEIYQHFINMSKLEKAQCPLLVDDECCIYNVRPIACRVHFVEENPNLCLEDPYRDSSPIASVTRKQIFNMFKHKMKIYLTPLPYIVAEKLLSNEELKLLHRPYL